MRTNSGNSRLLSISNLGEVMRQAINMVANGEIHVCFDLLHFLQAIHEGFLAADCYPISKEMGKKISTLRQSLRKVKRLAQEERSSVFFFLIVNEREEVRTVLEWP